MERRMLRKLICSCAKWRCTQTISSTIPYDYICANAPVFGGGCHAAALSEPTYSDESYYLNNAPFKRQELLSHWLYTRFLLVSGAIILCFIQNIHWVWKWQQSWSETHNDTCTELCAALHLALDRARYQYQFVWICMQAIYRHISAMTLLAVSKKSVPS